jgi:hypothetical protein
VVINNSIQGNSLMISAGLPDRSTTIDTLANKTDMKEPRQKVVCIAKVVSRSEMRKMRGTVESFNQIKSNQSSIAKTNNGYMYEEDILKRKTKRGPLRCPA